MYPTNRATNHPGVILLKEFMQPLGLSANALAQRLGVPSNRISAIVNGTRAITPDTALRLAKAFRTSPEFWLNLQEMHDLTKAQNDKATQKAVKRIEPIEATA